MRQASFRWHFTVIMVLLLAIPGGITAGKGYRAVFNRVGLTASKAAASGKVRELSDCTAPVSANTGDFAFRANLTPSPNNGLLNPRQNRPVWERIAAVKPPGVVLGFFFAIMVIKLFFIFYRNSRNGSGDDTLGCNGICNMG